MKLTIMGYYGSANFGDDLMLYVFIEELLNNCPDIEIDIYKNGRNKAPIFTPDNPRVTVMDITYKNPYEKYTKMISYFRSRDVLLWGGGTCFTQEDALGYFDKFLRAKLLGCKIGYISVGIGNLKDLSRKIKTGLILRLSDIVTFRDEISLSRAQELPFYNSVNTHLTEDLSYLFFKKNPHQISRQTTKEPSSLLISWRNFDNYYDKPYSKKLFDSLIKAVQNIAEKFSIKKITVLPLDSTKDKEIHMEIFSKLNESKNNWEVGLKEPLSPFEKIDIIAQNDLYFSARLHGLVIAHALNKPAVGFAYSPKIEYYCDGFDVKSYIKSEELIKSQNIVVDCFEKMIEKWKPIDLDEKIKKAQKNIEYLLPLLKKRQNG